MQVVHSEVGVRKEMDKAESMELEMVEAKEVEEVTEAVVMAVVETGLVE